MWKNVLKAYRLLDPKTQVKIPLAFLIMLSLSGLEILGISLIFPLIQSTLNGSNFVQSAHIAPLLKRFGITSLQHVGFIISILVFSLFIIKNILSIILTKWQLTFLAKADQNLSLHLMKRYLSLPYISLLSCNSVDIARNIMNVVSAACSGFLGNLLIIATEGVLIVGVVLMLMYFSPIAMLSIGLLTASMAWVFQRYYKEKIIQSGKDYLNVTTEAWKKIVQTFLVIKDLRILGREENVYQDFCKSRQKLFEVEVIQKFTQFLPRYFLEIVFSVAALLFCVVVFKVEGGNISTHLALLGVVGVAFVRLIPSVNRILITLQTVRANIPALEALSQLSSEVAPLEMPNPEQNSVDALPVKGLVLNDICFFYPNRAHPALHNINLNIQWGESIGLVGESGSGKSTLIDIIVGLLRPTTGQILLEGEDISNHLLTWRSKIGYVPQNIYLCDASLLYDITIGIPENQIDAAALQKAITLSNVASFLGNLPNGIHTLVGEGGVQLSGGQRQCIGIARALYHDPAVLILDEATSSLDNETESRISHMLEKLYGEKTLIIVAHRLSTVRRCDKIVFMENGSISGIDTFDLLQQKHLGFKRLVELGTLE